MDPWLILVSSTPRMMGASLPESRFRDARPSLDRQCRLPLPMAWSASGE